MRTLLTSVVLVLASSCGHSASDDAIDLGCKLDDAGVPGVFCHCFDGAARCNTACPVDLQAACTPGATCGDLSGGSDGEDCTCTCDGTGSYTCTGPEGTCVPQ